MSNNFLVISAPRTDFTNQFVFHKFSRIQSFDRLCKVVVNSGCGILSLDPDYVEQCLWDCQIEESLIGEDYPEDSVDSKFEDTQDYRMQTGFVTFASLSDFIRCYKRSIYMACRRHYWDHVPPIKSIDSYKIGGEFNYKDNPLFWHVSRNYEWLKNNGILGTPEERDLGYDAIIRCHRILHETFSGYRDNKNTDEQNAFVDTHQRFISYTYDPISV